MCKHLRWTVAAQVRPVLFEDQALPVFELGLAAKCARCGTPMKFSLAAPVVSKMGLLATLTGAAAGD